MRTILPGTVIVLVGLLVLFGILIYRISYPGATIEAVDPSQYLLHYEDVSILTTDGRPIPAWWIPGRKGAPGIILATGYGMSRTDALSLATALHQFEFNLMIFDQRGSGADPRGVSTLGLRETSDMIAVIGFLRSKPESDRNKIGIWGVDVSAFAALGAAAVIPEVKVIAADSPFMSVRDFLNYRIAADFKINSGLVRFICYQIFRLFYVFDAAAVNDHLPVDALSDKSILFIKGGDRPHMADLTSAVYNAVKPRKEIFTAEPARIHAMSGEGLREYDRQVSVFFQLNLK